MIDSKMSFAMFGDYDKDVKSLEDFAQTPVSAHDYYDHVASVLGIFNYLIQGTDRAKNYPQPVGLARRIRDELFPISFFASLYFGNSDSVFIESKIGNQNYDAVVDDRRYPNEEGRVKFLEVTTLQDKSDSDLLVELAEKQTVSIEGDLEQVDFDRKMLLLRKMLDQKSKKNYPVGTILLVYTDQDRFQNWHFGFPKKELDWQGEITKIANEFMPSLDSFSGVFIFCKKKIYFSMENTANPHP